MPAPTRRSGLDGYFDNGPGGPSVTTVTEDPANSSVPKQTPSTEPAVASANGTTATTAAAPAAATPAAASQPTDTPEQALQVEETETDEPVVFDPNRPIKLPTGEVVDWAEFSRRNDNYRTHVSKMQRADTEIKKAQAVQQIAEAAMSDPLYAKYVESILKGHSREEAYRIAGLSNPTAAAAQAAPTQAAPTPAPVQNGVMIDGILVEAPPSGEADSLEMKEWYDKKYLPAKLAAEEQKRLTPLEEKVKALEEKINKTETDQRVASERQRANSGILKDNVFQNLLSIAGIDVRTLTEAQLGQVMDMIDDGLEQEGIYRHDEKWMSEHQIDEKNVYNAIYKKFSRPVNPFVAPAAEQKQPVISSPRQDKPARIGGTRTRSSDVPSGNQPATLAFPSAQQDPLARYFPG